MPKPKPRSPLVTCPGCGGHACRPEQRPGSGTDGARCTDCRRRFGVWEQVEPPRPADLEPPEPEPEPPEPPPEPEPPEPPEPEPADAPTWWIEERVYTGAYGQQHRTKRYCFSTGHSVDAVHLQQMPSARNPTGEPMDPMEWLERTLRAEERRASEGKGRRPISL